MGAHDYTVVIRASDHSAVREKWADLVKEDSHESGNGSYAGNATTMRGAIVFHDRKLASASAARDYILDTHQKWSPALACSFYVAAAPDAASEARVNKARERHEAVEELQFKALQAVQATFRASERKLVSCGGCGSRISRKHLADRLGIGKLLGKRIFSLPDLPTCPVCLVSLLSFSVRSRLATLTAKVAKSQEDLTTAAALPPSTTLAWCVGGWAAS